MFGFIVAGSWRGGGGGGGVCMGGPTGALTAFLTKPTLELLRCQLSGDCLDKQQRAYWPFRGLQWGNCSKLVQR